MSIPRSEYPRPQFVRADWLCLNGEWEFEFDPGDSGIERGLLTNTYSNRIQVPFCPESKLSGIGNTDYLNAVWYRRTVTIPDNWADKRVLLHFQAVDYDATVWVNGKEEARHRGGFTPFTVDLRDQYSAGDTITIVLRARDLNQIPQARGKQAQQYAPHGCLYTRTTGIWQTVWLEPVPKAALKRPRITPDVANGLLRLEQPITQNTPGLTLHATVRDADGVVATAQVAADLDFAPRLDLAIPESRRRLWSISDPHLYDLDLELRDADGKIVDQATSYAGLRSVALDGKKVKINGEVVFQRLVLDQGYYIDGVMTAPSDQALIDDITLSQSVGFNGARLHQKVFEERFLYHADRLGYIVWGEFGDWGVGGYGPDHDRNQPGVAFVSQWLESLERDYSHPSIVGWCGLNETYQRIHDRITVLDDTTRAMFLAAKAMDTTRPVLDTSGYAHRVSEADIYDSHDYVLEQDFKVGLERWKENHKPSRLDENDPFINDKRDSIPYRGQPYFCSEFGGLRWTVGLENAEASVSNDKQSWGYGSDPDSKEDFYYRFAALCDFLLDNPNNFGYCYTQLTDIFPEENGLFFFDRKPKFDNERLKRIQTRRAAYEERG